MWSIQVEIHCSRGCSGSTVAVQAGVSLSLEVFSAFVGQAWVTALHVHVSKQGVLLVSQVCVVSSLLELTENIQTALTVTRFNLDLIIQHYRPLGMPIMGWCSPSKVQCLHLLPVVLQVVISASEPFGSQMPVFAPNRDTIFLVLIGTCSYTQIDTKVDSYFHHFFFPHRHHSVYFCLGITA